MSKQQDFVAWIQEMMNVSKIEPNENAKAYFEALCRVDAKVEKSLLTPNGRMIMKYLQSVPEGMYKARDIAEGLFISSKSVSGAMQKLCSDGYVEKVGKDPVIYTITEQGKKLNCNDEHEGEN